MSVLFCFFFHLMQDSARVLRVNNKGGVKRGS
jgi:hypothetical protein